MLKDLWRRVPTLWFNLGCLTFAFLWLALTIPWGLKHFETWPDFSQFYMGGVLASRGDWHALYPIPRPESFDNPGLSVDSIAKPYWDAIRLLYKVPNDTRFILPPPSALVFVPFSQTSLVRAYWIWNYILIGCTWGVALIAGRLHRHISGVPSRWEGFIALLIVLSPMTARAIRIANVSPPIALLIGFALLALIRREQPLRSWQGAVSVLMGALLKYATLILTPLLFAMRQWRMLILLTTLGIATLGITVALAGLEPFLEYYHLIMPTLSRPSAYPGNQSLPGFLVRIFGRPLPLYIEIPLSIARIGSLVAVMWLLFRTRQSSWLKPENVIAGAGLLVSWLMVFSPITWEHWPIFLCPIWGWLIWEARLPGWRRFFAISSILLMYFPMGIFQVTGFLVLPISPPEPFNSAQLFGVALTFTLAFQRLKGSRAEDVTDEQHSYRNSGRNSGQNSGLSSVGVGAMPHSGRVEAGSRSPV